MQPDRSNQPSDWQQPNEQPSRAPYEALPNDSENTPVVTLTPDEMSQAPQESQDPALISRSDGSQETEPVHWQAHEYIHRDKDALWFVVFSVVVLSLIVLSILANAITFTILLPVMAVALILYSQRPPRVIDYTLSDKGLHVNDRLYTFAEFRGFGVIRDGKEYSIMLLPIKRFRPGVSVYFPEEAGEAIVDMLATRLPMQELHLDIVDKVIRKLRI